MCSTSAAALLSARLATVVDLPDGGRTRHRRHSDRDPGLAVPAVVDLVEERVRAVRLRAQRLCVPRGRPHDAASPVTGPGTYSSGAARALRWISSTTVGSASVV